MLVASTRSLRLPVSYSARDCDRIWRRRRLWRDSQTHGARYATGTFTPIENIRRAAERITAERLDERIPSHGPADEIGRLINVLNATFERLQGSFEQAARFSADASHQLKTPIAVLRAGIEEILAQPGLSDEHREGVADLLQQTRRLNSVAENLLLLSRADTGRLALRATEFDLRKLLDGSLEDARILGAGDNLQIETNVPETLPMNGDQEMISLTVQNLVGMP